MGCITEDEEEEEGSWSLLCRYVPRAVVPIVLVVRIVSISPRRPPFHRCHRVPISLISQPV